MECFWFESGLNKQQGYRNTVGGKKKIMIKHERHNSLLLLLLSFINNIILDNLGSYGGKSIRNREKSLICGVIVIIINIYVVEKCRLVFVYHAFGGWSRFYKKDLLNNKHWEC